MQHLRSLLYLLLFVILSIRSSNLVHLSDDISLLIYGYLPNLDRVRGLALINTRFLTLHRTANQEAKDLMKEIRDLMDFPFVDTANTASTAERIKTIHYELCLNEQYLLYLPKLSNHWLIRDLPDQEMMPMNTSHDVAHLGYRISNIFRVHKATQKLRNGLVAALIHVSMTLWSFHQSDDSLLAMQWVLPEERVMHNVHCLLYRHLWYHIATKTNLSLPLLDAVYYLKENGETKSAEIKYLMHLIIECGLIVIHSRFREPAWFRTDFRWSTERYDKRALNEHAQVLLNSI